MATKTTKQREKMPDKDFAYVDDAGKGHLPIDDAAHVRNAAARFNQTHFESPEDKAKARRKILAAARAKGVDIDEDSPLRKKSG